MTKYHLRPKIRRMIDGFMPYVTKLMAVMLFIYGILTVYLVLTRSDDYPMSGVPNVIAGAVIMMICAVFIAVDKSHNMNRAIGFYALALGLSRLCSADMYLGSSSTVTFTIGIIMLVFAVNISITGVYFLRGTTRGRIPMMINSTLMFILNYVYLLDLGRISGYTVLEIIQIAPNVLVLLCLYIILICLLGTKQITDSGAMECYATFLENLRKTGACPPNAYIGNSTAKRLSKAFDDRSEWMDMRGHGPVESEMNFRIICGVKDFIFVKVQKWVDSDKLYFTITDHRYGSIIGAYRLCVVRILPAIENDVISHIMIICDDGRCIRLNAAPKEAVVQ